MISTSRPSRNSQRRRSTIIVVAGSIFIAAAVVTASVGGSLLLAAGLIAAALAVFALAPTLIGRPSGTTRQKMDATPAQLKEWHTSHPGSSITEALNAYTRP